MKLGERMLYALGRGLGSAFGDVLAREDDPEPPPSAARAIAETGRVLTAGTMDERLTLVPYLLGLAERLQPSKAPEPEKPKAQPAPEPSDDEDDTPPVTFPAALEEDPEEETVRIMKE